MTDAPECIWIKENEMYVNGWSRPVITDEFDDDSVEYIRADLVPQWQPIETAPKDGTEFLAFGWNFGDESQGHHIVKVQWARRGFRSVNTDFPSWGKSLGPGMYRRGSDDYFTPALAFITHWMPLPEPLK